jgi:hypothetical protein
VLEESRLLRQVAEPDETKARESAPANNGAISEASPASSTLNNGFEPGDDL